MRHRSVAIDAISVGNRDSHYLSHFEIAGAKRIYRHLSGLVIFPPPQRDCARKPFWGKYTDLNVLETGDAVDEPKRCTAADGVRRDSPGPRG
jgi:hypothetical protein